VKILGCDCNSRSITCALIDTEVKNITTFEVIGGDKNDYKQRVKNMLFEFNGLIKRIVPDVVYIEQAVMLQNVKTTLMIDGVVSVVRDCCILNNIVYEIIDNKSWKKSVIGNGKASKEEIMEFARLKGGCKITSQDVADAIAIATFGLLRLG